MKTTQSEDPCVLIAAVQAEAAGTLAAGFHEKGIVPTLAFTQEQVARCLQPAHGFRLLVGTERLLDSDLLHRLRGIQGNHRLPIITFGYSTLPVVHTAADVELPSGAGVEEIVGKASSLLALSHPLDLPAVLSWGSLELDIRRREARWQGREVSLTPIQFRIMEVLILAGGAVVDPDDLSRRLWGEASFGDGERILAHVRRIRRKIERDSSHPAFLLTVRGEGYRLSDEHARRMGVLQLAR